jgi:hypothetical protein
MTICGRMSRDGRSKISVARLAVYNAAFQRMLERRVHLSTACLSDESRSFLSLCCVCRPLLSFRHVPPRWKSSVTSLKPEQLSPTSIQPQAFKAPAGRSVSVFAEGLGKPRMLEVADDGRVANELDNTPTTGRGLRGVASVTNALEPYESAEGVPALQRQGSIADPELDILQRHWAPATQALVTAAGGSHPRPSAWLFTLAAQSWEELWHRRSNAPPRGPTSRKPPRLRSGNERWRTYPGGREPHSARRARKRPNESEDRRRRPSTIQRTLSIEE